ncbi:MAG TPA: hypothetical protein VNH53_07020 [Sphingomicrobium sp.]|nr:hypothetical protein [Sphingomicrobium sp.]
MSGDDQKLRTIRPGATLSYALIFGGIGLAVLSSLLLLTSVSFQPASTAAEDQGLTLTEWLLIGGFFIGVFGTGTGLYFNLDDKRRKDRAEAREIHDRRHRADDVH